MRTFLLAAAGALVGAQSAALAGETALRDAILLDDSAEAMSLSLSKAAGAEVSAQLQFRYDINLRDDTSLALANPDDDTTIGFSIRRARVNVAGQVTDNIKAKIQMDFNRATGTASLQEGYADWTINDGLKLRIGQQKLHFARENTVGSGKQLSAEASVFDSVFGSGYAQFVEAAFGGDAWRGWVAFSDGFNSRNTAFTSASEADYAFTGRAEFKFGDADFKAFDDFTSWRGSAAGGLIGGAFHWQTMGETNPSVPAGSTDMLSLTGDFTYEADGWNAHAAVAWMNTDGPGGDFDDWGFLVQGGIFLTDTTELFARFDMVSPDDTRAPVAPGSTVDDFSTITFGVNHYLVPESHAAKFTVAVMYYLDSVSNTGGVVGASDGLNLLADTEDGQVGITAQLQLLF
jgi:hypothetical protein